jgi:hypothetical protein
VGRNRSSFEDFSVLGYGVISTGVQLPKLTAFPFWTTMETATLLKHRYLYTNLHGDVSSAPLCEAVYGRLLYSHALCLVIVAIRLVNCVFSGVGKA